jgi:hypothetical protein
MSKIKLKANPQLFHKANLRCAKHVQNKFFSRAKSTLTTTSSKWKRISEKWD